MAGKKVSGDGYGHLYAGIDYEESGCPVCGGTTPPSEHAECLTSENLGTYYPDPDKPRGPL